MKKLLFITALLGLTASCSTYYTITPTGSLASISTRNIDRSANYTQIQAYAGVSRADVEAAISSSKKGQIKKRNPIIKEINQYSAKNLNEAVDNVVKGVAGGEFIQNVRVFQVNEIKRFSIKTFYVISGDVWGENKENPEIKGFHKNDKIIFTFTKDLKKEIGTKNFSGEIGKQYKGKVIGLKGGFATIELENSTVVDIPYSYLTNLGQ